MLIEQSLLAAAKLVDILDKAREAFVVLDREWGIAHINRRAADDLGKVPSEIIGKNFLELFPDLRGTRLELLGRRAMADQITRRFQAMNPKTKRWYDVEVFPSPEGLVLYARDQTERRRAEKAL